MPHRLQSKWIDEHIHGKAIGRDVAGHPGKLCEPTDGINKRLPYHLAKCSTSEQTLLGGTAVRYRKRRRINLSPESTLILDLVLALVLDLESWRWTKECAAFDTVNEASRGALSSELAEEQIPQQS